MEEEYLDIVDSSDNVTGKATKKEIYEKLLHHRIVHILLFNKKGKMALQLRGKDLPFCPDHWSTAVGGHVQSGETYEQAALREFMEEIGASAPVQFLYKDFYIVKLTGLKKFLGTFKADYEGPFRLSPREVQKVDFFSLEEIQTMVNKQEKFHPELLFILEKHFGIETSENTQQTISK